MTQLDATTCITIGTDETLKGDTFGGLVVAGVLATPEQQKKLIAAGIKDSKLVTDNHIEWYAKKIMEITEHWTVRSVYPEEYNKYTLTGLMNKLHLECYTELIKKITTQKENTSKIVHIVDKYPGCAVGDIVETKAESKYIAVAAASILARKFALEQLDDLSKQAGMILPKGSTHVQNALDKLFEKKLPAQMFVKLHFKNVQQTITKYR